MKRNDPIVEASAISEQELVLVRLHITELREQFQRDDIPILPRACEAAVEHCQFMHRRNRITPTRAFAEKTLRDYMGAPLMKQWICVAKEPSIDHAMALWLRQPESREALANYFAAWYGIGTYKGFYTIYLGRFARGS